jgi:hypothetical protein
MFHTVSYIIKKEAEDRVLKTIFGLKSDEVIGGWRKHNLYSLPSIIRKIKSIRVRF